MKHQLRAVFLHRANSHNQGFAIVVALGLGLSLTLIGLMMMTRSQGDVSTASNQRATAKSLAVAETAIVRIQTLIDRNRAIATYPICGNASLSDTSPCSDTVNPSWFNKAAIHAGGATISSAVPSAATRNWQNIDAANPSKGQYRIIDYSYDDTAKAASLTIEGRVEQDIGRGPSITRLTVDIPIVSTAAAGGIPGLWAQSFSMTNPGVKINAHVIDSYQQLTGGVSFAAANSPDPHLGTLPNIPIPNLRPYTLSTTPAVVTVSNVPFPPLPGNTYPGQVATIPAANMNNKACIQITTEEIKYPEDGDIFTDAAGIRGTYRTTDSATAPSMSGNYAYRFPNCYGGSISLNNTGSVTFGKSIDQTFSLFLDANLTTANTGTIKPFPLDTIPNSTNSAAIIIYSDGDINLNNAAALAPPEKFQIYNYGVHNITTANVGDIRGFIFAPESTVTSNNAGSFIGAVWAKRFSSSNFGSVYQANLDASKLKVTAPSTGSKNKMGGISSWDRQQVN